MIRPNPIEVAFAAGETNPETVRSLLMDCESKGRSIRRPDTEAMALLLRREAHAIIANRLTLARNRSRLNNDKINRLMHNKYLERGRIGKGWTFTNALNKRNAVLLDDEEVEMLSQILAIPEDQIALHLKVIPWALKDQKERQERRKKKTPAPKKKSAETITHVEADVGPSKAGRILTKKILIPASGVKSSEAQSRPVAPDQVPLQGGDIKISHGKSGIRVTGKIWSDLATAQKLRMIVPLKLIHQAQHDDPWCYEINSPVFPYQLYNLMHVLYGAPRVLKVEGAL